MATVDAFFITSHSFLINSKCNKKKKKRIKWKRLKYLKMKEKNWKIKDK